MRATLQALQAQTLESNETFVLRNHNGIWLASSTDVFNIKEEQETYRCVTGNDTHMTIEVLPIAHYEEDASFSRELD